MSLSKTIDQKFIELKFILEHWDKQSIKMDAHGGHTILFIYPPNEEMIYLDRIQKEYPDAYFINIAKIFTDYIDSIGLDGFVNIYNDYFSEPQKLFKSELSDDDLYQRILNKVEKAGIENKLPVLIRSGALFGTGIENISIMDSKAVRNLPLPLVIMYPASIGGDNKLKFLNFKIASDYRAVVIY